MLHFHCDKVKLRNMSSRTLHSVRLSTTSMSGQDRGFVIQSSSVQDQTFSFPQQDAYV